MERVKQKYFAASNSAEGFKSYYGEVFDPCKYSRIYVIKGGSGTGKGYFMKEVAREAEKRGFFPTYIYCSSDPESLDGVIIPELTTAIIDGTAPHVVEPSLVGAIEVIVDLGAFLNTSMLSGSRKVIGEIVRQKDECYERAYRYLAAYKQISENMDRMILPYLKLEKMKKFVARLTSDISGEGNEEYRLVRSVGMKGRVFFDTYRRNAEIYYRIDDHYESAHFLMQELYRALHQRGADMKLSPDPIISARYGSISFDNDRVAFEIAGDAQDEGRAVNMKRFLDGVGTVRIRGDFRAAMRVRDNVSDLAQLELEKAKKYHFTLEEIYGAAMDFEAKEQLTREICDKIFAK